MIIIEENYALKAYNTFGIAVRARIFAEANTPDDVRIIINTFHDNPLPKLILGGGSNILFTSDFDGIVIYPDIKGKEIIKHDESFVWIKAYCGENWDDFVGFCVTKNWGGLENLSLIPGKVGACPVQNIGAYGVEVKDTIDSIETIDLTNGEMRIFTNTECKFGYRDSIFKNELRDKYLIISVTFKLSTKPLCNINYKDLKEELKTSDNINVSRVREAIINIRSRKLPDPEKLGNAGSFFKNPVIDTNKFNELQKKFPEIPSYPGGSNSIKVPAAWLIQTCGWKGQKEGNVGSYPSQPLVIVNYGNANGKDIFEFAKKIQQSVLNKFSINLEMEVKIH